MRLVQISDTHFGTERPEVIAALQGTVADLRPDVVLLCGDITQRARRRQFAAARRFMDTMPSSATQIVVPGNHDMPLFNLLARAFAPYRNYERAFGARQSSWSAKGVHILALDATHPLIKDGVLPSRRLRDQLARASKARSPSDVFVVAAHQPLWTAWERDHRQTLVGRRRVARLFAQARVDLVLSGHVHVPMIRTSAVVGVDPAWQFVLSGSGTAVSHRTRFNTPNSFNVIDFAGPQMTVAQYDYEGARFGCVRSVRFARGAEGWSVTGPRSSTGAQGSDRTSPSSGRRSLHTALP